MNNNVDIKCSELNKYSEPEVFDHVADVHMFHAAAMLLDRQVGRQGRQGRQGPNYDEQCFLIYLLLFIMLPVGSEAWLQCENRVSLARMQCNSHRCGLDITHLHAKQSRKYQVS